MAFKIFLTAHSYSTKLLVTDNPLDEVAWISSATPVPVDRLIVAGFGVAFQLDLLRQVPQNSGRPAAIWLAVGYGRRDAATTAGRFVVLPPHLIPSRAPATALWLLVFANLFNM